ncbi:hypothetical protein E7T06_09820 [Deinococcus sp. Arct2-2]|nr:hypothetical protein E7T06_09735 [Deinococcus sp. Arct2-2]THF69936.1 hypothetical protein E7T06_09820 [Deinococcus sp. Arct2-2]
MITALEVCLDEPNTELDTLFRDVVYAFNEASDGFWINYAIQYAPQAKEPETALEYLEYIVGHPELYGVLGGRFSAAASTLGKVAPYPNAALRQLMTQPETGNEEADFDVQYARAAAFGAYVMTATSFEYGLEAGRAIRDKGEQPTLEKAEALIRAWPGSCDSKS